MTYCRQRHTLIDNEAEAEWERLPPGSFFELVVNAVTYFGIVDEYVAPTPTNLICALYSDSARTIQVTTSVPTGLPYEINNFVNYLHDAKDAELNPDSGMGVWRSPQITIRDDTGVWNGQWIAAPKTDGTVQFNFDGTHTLFKASVEQPLAGEVAGVGLGAGTYIYCIVPVDGSGRLGAGSRTLSVTLAGSADILIDWLPNTQVSQWNVYGRVSGGTFGLLTTLPGSTVSYLDNGVDVPNPAFQPPLFEDPAWTVAVADREVDGTDGDIIFDAEGTELGSTKLDDGTTVSSFDATLDVALTNTTLGQNYLLSDVKSQSSVKMNVVLDPTMFTDAVGPIQDLPPIVINYDYHVFINSSSQTVISESNSFTGQTTEIIVNLVTNTFDITVSDSTGVIATDSVPITEGYVIPLPGSLSSKYTFSDFQVQPDGTILGTHQIDANTYQVTPLAVPGIGFITTQNFGTPSFGEIAYTLDSGVSWANYSIPGTRLIAPPGFTTNRQVFLRAHGEGWTVVGLVNHPTVPSLVSDYSLHWTPDLTAVPWPFNDPGGRVALASITAANFTRVNASLAPTTSGGAMGTFTIRKFANGLGPVMSRDLDTDDQLNFAGPPGQQDIDFFFPATGSWIFQSPGLTKYRHNTFWKEKNLLIGLEQGFVNNIWTNPITTSPAAPLGPQSFQHSISFTPNQILALGTTANMAYVVWKRVSTSQLGYSFSFDGVTWTDVLVNNTNSADYTIPGQEMLGVYPGDNSDPQRNGNLMWLRNTGEFAISTDNGNTWNNTPTKAAGSFNAWKYRPFVSGVFGEITSPKTPMLWDGIAFMADNPNTFLFPGGQVYRMDSAFADLVPNIGGAYGIGGSDVTEDSQTVGTTIGSAGSPNGIPGANLRRYLGRSVVIPLAAVVPPPPFVISDPTGNAYNSTRTTKRDVQFGNMRGTITQGPGGLGQAAVTVIENGQDIIINIPNSSEAAAAARKPVPVNMKWTSVL